MKNNKPGRLTVLTGGLLASPLRVIAAVLLLVLPTFAVAVTEVTPSVAIKETLINTESSTLDDSGTITTLTPGVMVTRDRPRSSLLLDYRLNLVTNHGYDQDDQEVHLLRFFTNYQHRPGIWVSSLRASSQLTNIDPNGVQNTNPEIVDDNTTELHTVGVDSVITDRVTDTVDYRASVNADVANYADSSSDDTYGKGFLVGLNNEQSTKKLLWSTTFDSQESGDADSDSTIDTANVFLRYLFSSEWSGFVSYTDTNTDFEAFDDEASLLGVTWRPNSRNLISVGAGKRGDDNNYSLDMVYTLRNLTFSANYEEAITTARADTLRRQQSELIAQPTSQSLSFVPVLQKSSSLNMVATGKYSVITISAFQTDRSEATDTAFDEVTTGLRFRYTRNLTAKDRISLDLLDQETEEEETNDLNDLTLTYTHQRSKSETLDFSASYTKQDSTDEDNEYERSLLSAQYQVSF